MSTSGTRVGYRAVLRLHESESATKVANEHMRSWLRDLARDSRKSITQADWDGPGTHELGSGASLTVVEDSGDDGTDRLLLEFTDSNSHGRWITRVVAVSAPNEKRLKQTLMFESEGYRADGSGVNPGTPNLVRNLLGTVDAFDGEVPVTPTPDLVEIDDVERLLGYVTDENRDISVIVIAPVPGVPIAKWREATASLMRDSRGCAAFFILTPEALEGLNSRLSAGYRVPRGSVRTFAPRVDLNDLGDTKRHKVLTARTMSEGLREDLRFAERLVRLVAITPRKHLLEAPLPPIMSRAARLLERARLEQARSLRSALPLMTVEPAVIDLPVDHPAVDPPDSERLIIVEQEAQGPPWMAGFKRLAAKILGQDSPEEQAIEAIEATFARHAEALAVTTAQVEALQTEREAAEDELLKMRQRLEAEQFERDLAEDARKSAEKRARALEHWQSTHPERYTYVGPADAAWESDPLSVSEIIERLTDDEYAEVTRYVELTDVDKAIDRADEIDGADPNGSYASAFWEHILILRDYVIECTEHGFSGNVHLYLQSPDVRGRKCPIQRHKSNESETVRNSRPMRLERTFPVPAAVEASGEVFMTTHFAPTHRDQNAPRMYYYADVNNTGKAYIGYIGVHLTNTKTN
ncbi:hypothetical protein GCM10027425_23550 [Alteromonas gracilis]